MVATALTSALIGLTYMYVWSMCCSGVTAWSEATGVGTGSAQSDGVQACTAGSESMCVGTGSAQSEGVQE